MSGTFKLVLEFLSLEDLKSYVENNFPEEIGAYKVKSPKSFFVIRRYPNDKSHAEPVATGKGAEVLSDVRDELSAELVPYLK